MVKYHENANNILDINDKNSANPEELNVFIQNIIRYSLNNTEQECIESKDKEL